MMRFPTILAVSAIIVVTSAAPVIEENFGELGEYFEGDMVLTKKQREAIDAATLNRNGLRDVAARWPQRTVVYYIKEDDFVKDHLDMIHRGMADIANQSCVRFRQNETEDEPHVYIQGSIRACFSDVGFVNSNQQLMNLGSVCFGRYGTVVHEMLHTLGFFHMQSTYNRDEYVRIEWDNIIEGKGHNFQNYTSIMLNDFGVPYDYESVLHYSNKAFSKNGEDTIVPLQEGAKIGQRKGLSASDVLKLNRMYCPEFEAEVSTESAEVSTVMPM